MKPQPFDPTNGSSPPPQRLAKLLAQAGVGSRRSCEELIRQGRVDVDGVTVIDPATATDAHADLRVDGSRIQRQQPSYWLLNKPRGVICTSAPGERKRRAVDLVPDNVRLFTVGRLDEDSEGLLLLTNDGELAYRLTHPSFEIPKIYRVKVRGRIEHEALQAIRDGVQLAEGRTAPVEIHVKKRGSEMTSLEVMLREGMNREIRRIFASCGHNVYHLKRVRFGPIALGKLPNGECRPLTHRELNLLQQSVARAEQRRDRMTRQPTKRQPTKRQPTKRQPTKREPTKRQPTRREPTKREPTRREPTRREPTKREPTRREPTKREPTTRQPTTRQPTTRQPTRREPTTRQPTRREPTTRQPTRREPTKRQTRRERPNALDKQHRERRP